MNTSLEISEATSVSDAEAMAQFFNSVWQDDHDVVPFDLILAASHVGGYATLAKLNGSTVGASFGFRGSFAGQAVLHSHVTASQHPGVGFALKQHQFRWAQERGISAITWTFDPLVRRNCVFNFEKLGAYALEYLPNFYGTMTDAINAGDNSDRLVAYWPLSQQVSTPQANSQMYALQNHSGTPHVMNSELQGAFWIELPEDIEELRKSNVELARRWRIAVRDVLKPKLDAGWFIHAVSPDRTAILVEPASAKPNFEEHK